MVTCLQDKVVDREGTGLNGADVLIDNRGASFGVLLEDFILLPSDAARLPLLLGLLPLIIGH